MAISCPVRAFTFSVDYPTVEDLPGDDS